MYLRYKHWRLISDQQQAKVVQFHNRKYMFFKKNLGECDVNFKGDIERLLSPPDGVSREFEIVFEKHGIKFNDEGYETSATTPISGTYTNVGVIDMKILDGKDSLVHEKSSGTVTGVLKKVFRKRGRPRRKVG